MSGSRTGRRGGALYPAAWRVIAGFAVAGAVLFGTSLVSSPPAASLAGSVRLVEGMSAAVFDGDLAEWDASSSWAAEYGSALPEGFAAEALALDGVDARVSESGPVVGYSAADEPEEALASVEAELSSKGWTAVESGNAAAQTFVKGEGRYRWLSVSCTRVGEATSVVVVVKEVDDGQ